MKHLYLLRHGKTKRARQGEADRLRPLSGRGRREVVAMSLPLLRLGALEGEIHVSEANRTRQTLLQLDEQLPERAPGTRSRYQETLYTFSGATLLHWLKTEPREADTLLLIGHNPALLDLARWLCTKAPAALPTGGLLHIKIPGDSWQSIGKHRAELADRLTPAEASHALFQRKAPKAPEFEDDSLPTRILGLLDYQYRLARALEPGVIAGFDTEFLHQYRVNLRRSRAIGESLRAITRVPGLKNALMRLKQRARDTSDVRDLDVFLESLAGSPPDRPDDIHRAVRDWLIGQRRERHEALGQSLAQPRHASDMTHWKHVIAGKPFRRALHGVTLDQVKAVLDKRISRHDADLAALSSRAADERFHALRKTVKRLRYLAELHPRKHQGFLKRLKQRQTLLGDFQDLCTRQVWLMAFVEAAREAGRHEEVESACSDWIEDIERRKEALRQAILASGPLSG